MIGFVEPAVYRANGKIYGRVGSGTKVVEPSNGDRALLAVSVVSALSLVLATVSVVLCLVVGRDSTDVWSGQRKVMRVCLPCYEVKGSKPTESDLSLLERFFQSRGKKWSELIERTVQEEDGECCADDANQLEALLNEILDEKKEESDDTAAAAADAQGLYPTCDLSSLSSSSSNGTACLLPASLSLNPTAVAAHLVSLASPASSATNSGAPVGSLSMVKWNPDSRRSFFRGLTANSTHLFPSKEGLYFVYSQVSFSIPFTSEESLIHQIKRFNTRYPNGGNDLLMQHSSTVQGYTPSSSSSPSSLPITDSSFLGGLVRVHPKDKFYVEVSHSKFLRSLPTATFFGMFRLS